jgi:cytochrome P450
MLAGMRRIAVDPLAFLAEQWRRHGDVVQFPIPSPPTYLVCHPDDVRTVLVTRARDTGKDTLQYRALSRVTGRGLLTSDGAHWREHRRVIQPAFHPSTLAGVAAHTERAAAGLVTALRSVGDGSVVDVDPPVMAMALEVVGDSLFGHQLGPVADRLAGATLEALGEVVAMARMPLRAPRWMPTPGNRRMAHATGELDGAVAAILARRQVDGPSDPPDMLDLMRAADLSAQEVRDEIVTFLVAGHETVASALTWSWALLSEHPEQQERLAAEARDTVGDRFPGMADLPRLPYARAVFDEALRLYPPAWLITRRSHEADEVGGRSMPGGSLVILSPWLLHRHPDLWERPAEFAPERFLGDGVDRRGFIPFGAGPRLCIGRDFAYVEGVLLLAAVAARYRADRVPGTPRPVAEPLVTVRPAAGLPLRLLRRS